MREVIASAWRPPRLPPPQTCARCGALVDVDWCEVTAVGEAEPRYVPGMVRCLTPGCGTTCPICHREPGDIHSGACAPIVLAKLVDPTRVTLEDCRRTVPSIT